MSAGIISLLSRFSIAEIVFPRYATPIPMRERIPPAGGIPLKTVGLSEYDTISSL